MKDTGRSFVLISVECARLADGADCEGVVRPSSSTVDGDLSYDQVTREDDEEAAEKTEQDEFGDQKTV